MARTNDNAVILCFRLVHVGQPAGRGFRMKKRSADHKETRSQIATSSGHISGAGTSVDETGRYVLTYVPGDDARAAAAQGHKGLA